MDIYNIETEDKIIEVYRFIFTPVKTNMYFIISGNEAVIIDPHESEESYELLINNNIDRIKIILTHEHFDHSSGVNWFKDRFDSELICQDNCAKSISIARNNRPLLVAFVLSQKEKINGGNALKKFVNDYKPYSCHVDITYETELIFESVGCSFHLISTPGHTPGSSCVELNKKLVFTGDTMIKGEPVITRFPGGDIDVLNKITIPYLNSLDNDVYIMPGHGNPFYKNEITIGKYDEVHWLIKGGS